MIGPFRTHCCNFAALPPRYVSRVLPRRVLGFSAELSWQVAYDGGPQLPLRRSVFYETLMGRRIVPTRSLCDR